MPDLRTTTLVDAPVHTVAGALLDVRLITESLRGLDVRIDGGGGGLLSAGDELSSSFGPARGRLRVTRADLSGVAAEMVEGPLPSLRLRTDLVVTGGGTMVVDAMEWTSPGGPLGRLADLTVGRGIALRVLQARAQAITRRAGELATARVVVGAAIVRDGRLLAQQRDFPADAAGKWELPGGRVDPGETDADALVRECVEELGVTVRVGEQVGPDVPLKTDLLLRIFAGELDGPGEPEAVEHRDLRWVSAGELDALDWLPADRALLPDLRRVVGP